MIDAEAYDRWSETPWGRYASRVEARAITGAIGTLAGLRVLDAGCGTGRFTEVLARAGANVIGLDADEAMLRVARRRGQAPLVLADARALPFADETFDVTVAVTLCEFTERPERVVAEMARTSRRTGRIVIGALNPRSPWGLAHRRRFRRPPWDSARFLSASELRSLGAPYGETSLTSVLYAPGRACGRLLGRVMEKGRFLAPGFGAFRVLTVRRS